MSVIMILAMVPSAAFAATSSPAPYDVWAYNIDTGKKTVLKMMLDDGTDKPTKAEVLEALKEAVDDDGEQLVDDNVTEDELEIKFYNGDEGNIKKMLKGKGTEYKFTKAKLRLDHIAMTYDVVKPEFDGTVSFNVYLENDKETPAVTINKDFKKGEAYEDVIPTANEIIDALAENGIKPAAGHHFEVLTDWFGDGAWLYNKEEGSAFDVSEKAENETNLHTLVKEVANKVTISFDFDGGVVGKNTAWDDLTEDAGYTLNLPYSTEIKKDGYTFLGWSANGSEGYIKGGEYVLTEDTHFVAVWAENTYTVSFKAGTLSEDAKKFTDFDDVTIPDETVAEGGKVTTTAPEVEGYDFTDWYVEYTDGTYRNDLTKISDPIYKNETFCAVYKKHINEYTATFDFNGGKYTDKEITAWNPIVENEGTQIVLPKADDMKLDGWTFAGWNVYDADNELIATVDTTADRNYTLLEDVNFVAVWTRDVDLVLRNSDGNGKLGGTTLKVTKGEATELPDATETFADKVAAADTVTGWYRNAEFKNENAVTVTNADDDCTTYTALVNVATATATFDLDGGSVKDTNPSGTGTIYTEWIPTTVKVGANVWVPTDDQMIKDGYTFLGWYVGNTKVDGGNYVLNEDTDFVAKWTPITYTVSFKAWDKIDKKFIDGGYEDETVGYNSTIATTAKDIAGYEFAGKWFILNDDGTIGNVAFDVENTIINKDITLVPVYSRVIVKHTVTIDLNGGTLNGAETSKEIENGFTLEALGTPTKTNRTFNGWYLVDADGNVADEAYDFATPVTEDITLKALYDIKVEYNIYKDTFSGNLITAQKVVLIPEDADVEAYLDEVFAENVTATDYDKVYKWYSRKVWVENYNSGFDARIAAFENGAETIDFSKLDSVEYSADKGFRVFAMLVTDANAVTITFDNVLYGDAVEPMKIVKGSALGDVAVENVKDGYQLEGWYNGTTKVDANTTFNADTVLKAKWNVLVTFNTYKNGDFTTPEVTTEWVAVKINGGEGRFTTEAPTHGWYTKADWDKVAAGEDMDFNDITPVDTLVTAPATYYGMETEKVNVSFSAGTGVKATGIPTITEAVYGSTLGDVLGDTAAPVRDKYQFVCWTVNGNDVDDTYVITENTDFVAKWEARDITVSFEFVNATEGSDAVIEAIASQTIKYGEKAAEPTVTINGDEYRVDGWYNDEACKDKVDFATQTFTADATTLYAKVEAKVTLNVYTDASSLKPMVAEVFAPVNEALNTDALKTSYTNGGKVLYGWYTPENWANIQKGGDYTFENTKVVDSFTVTEPVEFYGKVSEGFTVTFSAGEGVIANNMPEPSTVIVNYGKKVAEPTKIPTRTGYTFDGWAYDFESPVYHDTIITAKWTLNTYIINYDPNGGVFVDGAKETRSIAYGAEYGELLTNSQVSRDGAKLIGWTTEKDNPDTLVKPRDKYLMESDSTLYALWEITGVTVTYVTNGGKVADLSDTLVVDSKGNEITHEKLPYGTAVNDVRKAVKDGLKFRGWYLDEDLTVPYDNSPIKESVTLYAKYYAEITFQIYENDNYAATIGAKTIEVDEYGKVELPTAEDLGVVLRDTDEFFGWYTVGEFGKVQAGQEAVTVENVTATGEVTYCAKVLRHYIVTFNTNGGSEIAAQDVVYKGLATRPEVDPTRVGYVFTGWFANEALTTPFDFNRPITADTTVYAKWNKAKVTVTFNMDKEWMGLTSSTKPVEIYYGDVVPADAVPGATVPGYTFDGWYLNGKAFDVATTPVTENITLDAAWHLNQFDAEIVREYTYTGAGIAPKIKVTDSTTKEAVDLTANPVDITYTAVSENAKLDAAGLPKNAGTYKVTVSQKYVAPKFTSYKYCKAAPVELTLEVKPANISEAGRFNAVLVVNNDSETAYDPANLVKINFTGSEILLDGTSKEGYKLVVFDTVRKSILDSTVPDFEIKYANNVNAGTATATVTGVGNYTGTLEVKFEIAKLQINIGPYQVTIDPESYVYNGVAQQPNVTVKKDKDSPELTYGVDYVVGYMPADDKTQLTEGVPVNVGTYKLVVEGRGNYEGTTNSEPDFKIIPKDISNAEVVYETEWDYTESAIEPPVTVTVDDKELVKGTDYTVEYKDNVNAGEATIIITGIGNYKGSVEKKFTIKELKIDIRGYVATLNPDRTIYNGEVQKPAITVTPQTTLTRSIASLEEGREFTVSYKLNGEDVAKPKEAGVYTVVITGVGNFINSIEATYTIEQKEITADMVTVDVADEGVESTGAAIEPEVKVKDGDKVLVKGTDYEVEYSNNVEPGTATVTVNGIGNYKGLVEKTFTITSKYYYVTGVVRFSSGRVIKFAKVTLTGTDYLGNEVVRTTKTDKYGKYTIKNLKKGNYIVTYRNESKAALLNEQN